MRWNLRMKAAERGIWKSTELRRMLAAASRGKRGRIQLVEAPVILGNPLESGESARRGVLGQAALRGRGIRSSLGGGEDPRLLFQFSNLGHIVEAEQVIRRIDGAGVPLKQRRAKLQRPSP